MSVKDISEKSPIQTIPRIIGETTYKAIKVTREAMYANTAAITTVLEGGKNGHIGLLMDAAVYGNIAATAYVRPMEPGSYAQHGPGDSAAAQADANAIHEEGRRIYDLDENVDAALKQEIIAAVNETYLYAKKQRHMGFHGISAKNLVDHLMEKYRNIWASDLEACRQALAEPI